MVALHAAVVASTLFGAGETVLYDFSAAWCGPCQQMAPVVEQLKGRGYPVRKVDIDQNPGLVAKFGIGPIPCFVMVVNGREVDREIGAASIGRLEQMLRRANTASAPSDVTTARGQSPDHGGSSIDIPRMAASLPREASGFRPHREEALTSTATADLEQLRAASVRLKVLDPSGHSFGTGTIIDAREGKALVLTCGHLFRDSGGTGSVTVDLFGPGVAEGIQGQVIGYDLERDLGLVMFSTSHAVTVAPVAPAGYQVSPRETVHSVGCDHGQPPSLRTSQVATINKYLGPPNLQVRGQPVQGRSGGGLFNAAGQLIGVCNAADPAEDEGLFAALASIHAQLDEAGLAFVYQSQRAESMASMSVAAMRNKSGAVRSGHDTPRAETSTVSILSEVADVADAGVLSPGERATLDELRRRADGAEVICIVRPLKDPRAKSEIIVLDRASPAFLNQLSAERRVQDGRQLTSFNVSGAGALQAHDSDARDQASQAWRPHWLAPRLPR